MDASKFTSDKTGELVKVSVPEEDWAFIPAPLPPQWQFPNKLWPLLAKARESLARLDGIGRTLPNPELLLRPLEKREALRSSSLEGTFASPEELLLFELHPREPQSEKDPANAWREVSNYSLAIRQGMRLLEELPFCVRLIKELHRTLLSGVRGKNKTPGEVRTCQVHIGSDRRFIPPPPNYIHECLSVFEKYINKKDNNYDPLVLSYLLHYQFEVIHPFIDGNGRVGRVLMSLLVYKWCNLSMPWLYLSAYFEKYKDEYIDNLFHISARGDWDRWIEFCLQGTIIQAEDSIRRCDALGALKDDFMRRAGHVSARAHSVIEALFATPLLTIPGQAKQYDVSYPTAKSDVMKLVEMQILREIPDAKPKIYYSPEIFKIAYEE